MRRAGGNRNTERQGRGQGQQGSPMAPPGPSMGYQQHHQHHNRHHHHSHHSSSYSGAYDGSRPPPHNMQPVPPHGGFGPAGGGGGGGAGCNGWNGPRQPPMPMYNQNFGPMGGYAEMHQGQYPPSPSPPHMGGGSGMPLRSPPMPGPYGGLPGQGPGMPPVNYGRGGGYHPMDAMQPAGGSGGGMYGVGPMVRHDGVYPDHRLSPPPPLQQQQPPPPQQVGGAYGPNVGAPLPPGHPYGGTTSMYPRSPAVAVGGVAGGGGGSGGGYPDQRGKTVINTPMPVPNASRQPRIGTPEPGMMGGGIPPPGQFNQQSALSSSNIAPHSNFMPGGNMQQNQMPMIPTPMNINDPSNVDDYNMRMSAENLREFLRDRNLVSVDNLSSFFPEGYDPNKDAPLHIAVDGNYCLNSLRDELRRRDSLWFLHSSLPEELLEAVSRHVEGLRSLCLEPIWVFNGLGISGDVETFLTSEGELRARDIVWSELEGGTIPDETSIQTAFDQPLEEDVQMSVLRYLRKELNVMAVTAPFLNWAQMVAFHKEGLADLLMGPAEVLLLPYDNVKLILQIDVSSKAVYYFDRDKVLRALFPYHVKEDSTKVAGDRLMDLGLITAKHPALSSTSVSLDLRMEEVYKELSTNTPRFRSIKEFINAHASAQETSKKKTDLNIKHSKGRGYLRYSCVFSSKQPDYPLVYLRRVLEPNLTDADMPTNLVGVLGNLVPLSLFYLQFVGLLPVRIMAAVTQSYIRDDCPVSDTRDYHERLEYIMILRSQVISQILRKITNDKQSKTPQSLSWVRWFEPLLRPVPQPKSFINLDEWDISTSEEVANLDEDHLEDYSIATVLTFSTEALRPVKEERIHSPHERQIRYHGRKETFFAILLKTFDFLGYFSHSTVPTDRDEEGMMAMEGGEEEGDEQGEGGSEAMGDVMMRNTTEGGGCGGRNISTNNNSNNGHVMDEFFPTDEMNEDSAFYFPTYLMNAIRNNPRSFQNAFVALTELLRVEIIGRSPCKYIDPSNPLQYSTMDSRDSNCDPRVLLASRIACLITLPYRRESEDLPFIWTPVYSRHLCAFTVMARTMWRCLRELVEVITTTVFLSGNSDCSLVDFSSFSFLLPFEEIPSAIGGLLLHYVLVFPSDYQVDLTTRHERLEYLQDKFRDIPNIGENLRTVMTFTLQALYLINAYKLSDLTTLVPPDLRDDYTVERTIKFLWEKWYDHIDDDPPQDVNGLYKDTMLDNEGDSTGG